MNKQELLELLNDDGLVSRLFEGCETITAKEFDWLSKQGHHMEDHTNFMKLEAFLNEFNTEFTLEKDWGGEDQGSDYGAVWSVQLNSETLYLKKTGWYASHVGVEDWTDLRYVEPKQVTTTEYV